MTAWVCLSLLWGILCYVVGVRVGGGREYARNVHLRAAHEELREHVRRMT